MCTKLDWLLPALASGLLMACSDATAPSNDDRTALDSVLAAERDRAGVPAIAAAVVRADRIEALGAVGVRRLGAPEEVTVDDRFHLGSNVKAMTATLIAALVEDGTLAWDLTAAEAFPELAQTMDPDHAGVTLRQLLQHRAGIEPLLNFAEVPPLPGTPSEQRATGTALLLQLPAPVPVGTFLYSNGGYTVAAAMAEARAGRSWEELLRTRLLDPLGLSADFGWPAADDPEQPWGHVAEGGGFAPRAPDLASDPHRVPTALAPAGDLSMSVRDYAGFVQLHLRGLTGRAELLERETFERLHTPVEHYAMGWGEVDIGGVRTATHDGSAGTFWATAWIQPSRGLAVVVLVNAGGERAGGAAAAVATELLRRYGGVAAAASAR